jgi:hypothetical protein
MSYYTKIKKDFSFRKIKFKGIECFEGDGKLINVTVTGTAQMIRQILKNQWAVYNAEGTWVKTRKFANGNAIDVYLNRFPDDVYKAIKSDLVAFEEDSSHYRGDNGNKPKEVLKTDDGVIIDAGTKYLHIKNEPPYDSKENDQPAPDWEQNKKEKPTDTPKPKSSGNPRFDKGELLKECAGWDVYKKTLPNKRIVYSAYKKRETAPNKEDWNLIKGDIYTETGFKWGRFGFEKWGQIASEAMVIQTLCNLFAKYYGGGKEEEKNKSSIFVYGEDWDIPREYGNILIETLKGFGFEIFDILTNSFSIFKLNVDLTIYISDNGGEFNIVNDITKVFITSLNYTIGNKDVTPFTLAKMIEEIYIDNTQQTQPKDEFKINEDYKSLPANPKLEYCKINSAEGLIDYADTFPKTFQSFTALTKYIADNIGEMPKQGQGYDKHSIEWKWKFQDQEEADRWDVSESEANPFKYPNLYASENLRSLCYYAWAKEHEKDFFELDDFFATEVGKDGLELSSDQFTTMLTDYLTYYKTDDNRRFTYLTPESRLQRFKEVYPKLIAIFEEKEESKATKEIDFKVFEDIVLGSKDFDSAFRKAREIKGVDAAVSAAFREKYDTNEDLTPQQAFLKFYNEIKGIVAPSNKTELSNEQINKLIKALSYLADEGDETAKKKMKAYKYLLN